MRAMIFTCLGIDSGIDESSGFMSDTSVKIAERESAKQVNTTLVHSINFRQNMVAPMHRGMAREKKYEESSEKSRNNSVQHDSNKATEVKHGS